jgi:hypothetical protein
LHALRGFDPPPPFDLAFTPMAGVLRGQSWRLSSGFPRGVEDFGQYHPSVYQRAAEHNDNPRASLERIASEAASHIDAGEASGSVDLAEETSKGPVVDEEVRESEEEIEESETLAEVET